jgi:protein N-terminal methyltransferase
VPEADNFYCCGFQDFDFVKNGDYMYDCIWL